MRTRMVAALLAVVVLVGGGVLVACADDDPGPGVVLNAFFTGWGDGNLDAVAVESPDGVLLSSAQVLGQLAELAGDLDPRRVTGQAVAPPSIADDRAIATVNVEWKVVDDVIWPYQTTVALHRVDGAWRIVFSPATVHPRLHDGEHLAVARVDAVRGGIVDGGDTAAFAPVGPYGQALLGTVGPATNEQRAAAPGRYLPDEPIGQSGLQQLYDDVLRGRPGVRISILEAGEVLGQVPPQSGSALHTTLDAQVQAAAEEAVAHVGSTAQVGPAVALAAVRVSDGVILAAANGPAGGLTNLAFTATSAPGPAFQLVSTSALLDAGLVDADTPVACPATVPVAGREIENPGGLALGTVPFHVAFARSCDTALAAVSAGGLGGTALGSAALVQAATSLGIGTTWNLGTPVTSGGLGSTGSAAQTIDAVLGRGDTAASPVALAVAAATVARGGWRAPRLFPELPPGAPAPTPAADPPAEGTALNLAPAAVLRNLMRECVTTGTAQALADVPGGAVYARTGVAGVDGEQSWVVGWQGDVAFAAFVGEGDASALPVVEAFLRALARPGVIG